MLRSVFNVFKPNPYYAVKSFSYFLPAPPKRNSGYQEKEFDRVIDHLNELGFELIDMKTQSHNGTESAGIWIFCKVGALTKAAAKIQINIDYQEIAGISGKNIPLDPDIVHEA